LKVLGNTCNNAGISAFEKDTGDTTHQLKSGQGRRENKRLARQKLTLKPDESTSKVFQKKGFINPYKCKMAPMRVKKILELGHISLPIDEKSGGGLKLEE